MFEYSRTLRISSALTVDSPDLAASGMRSSTQTAADRPCPGAALGSWPWTRSNQSDEAFALAGDLADGGEHERVGLGVGAAVEHRPPHRGLDHHGDHQTALVRSCRPWVRWAWQRMSSSSPPESSWLSREPTRRV